MNARNFKISTTKIIVFATLLLLLGLVAAPYTVISQDFDETSGFAKPIEVVLGVPPELIVDALCQQYILNPVDVNFSDFDEVMGDFDEVMGDFDETAGDFDETAGDFDETSGDFDETSGDSNSTRDILIELFATADCDADEIPNFADSCPFVGDQGFGIDDEGCPLDDSGNSLNVDDGDTVDEGSSDAPDTSTASTTPTLGSISSDVRASILRAFPSALASTPLTGLIRDEQIFVSINTCNLPERAGHCDFPDDEGSVAFAYRCGWLEGMVGIGVFSREILEENDC